MFEKEQANITKTILAYCQENSLIGLLPDKKVMVGVIDVTRNDIETPEQVANTIAEACRHVAPEQVMACTNCGLAPMPKPVAVGKLQALGQGAMLARSRV